MVIDGYVNAVERDSKPLTDPSTGARYLEQVRAGAFQRALDRGGSVLLLSNHNYDRVLGATGDNLLLHEDTIGLRAHAVITDPEVISDAREHRLKGWSFGFRATAESEEDARDGMKRRFVEDLDLIEVSIISGGYVPAYNGTLIEARAEAGSVSDVLEVRADYVDAREPIDFTPYRERIAALKKEE